MSRPPRTRRRRIALIVGGLVLVLCVATLGVALYLNYRVNRFAESAFRPEQTPPQTQYGDTPTPAPTVTPLAPTATPPVVVAAARPTAPPPPTNTPAPTPTATPAYGNSPVIARLKAGQRVNVLLLGFGGPGHDGAYLTDSIQIMSFDPVAGVATLISVPRDLWVFIPPYQGRGGYWGKINEAYTVGMGPVNTDDENLPYSVHDGGGTLASKVVAEVTGIPIDYWVSLDFVGFRQFIDALGGVDVTVDKAFTDTHYPNNDDAALDASYKTVHFDCGPQHLDGERAIEYARSRYSPQDGSDFARSHRQQLLMRAVKERVFRLDTIPKVLDLLDALEGHVHTSFSFTEAKDLAGWAQEQIRDNRKFAVHSTVIDEGPLLYHATSSGGAYILLPRDGQGEYGAIHEYVRAELNGAAAGTPGASPARGTPVSATAPSATPAGAASPDVSPTPAACGGN
ncbi:MAG TPA: LCP family protein [Thermomicrobiales bacterium]|nr:LCP family protein [Thermomicrobiales bacterium]